MPFKQLKALGRLFILFLMLSVSLGGVCENDTQESG